MPKVALLHGDSIALLTATEGARAQSSDGTLLLTPTRRCIHAVVTDPPYGFDFAGDKDWDTFEMNSKVKSGADDSAQFAKFTRDWSYPLLRDYMFPGAHLLAFSADRTIDLVGRGLREAGFDIVKLIFWLYASGQVKQTNGLRPGCEPIFVGRVPTEKNLTDLFKKDGIGQLHAQTWKEEDGKHPNNVIIDESLVAYEGCTSTPDDAFNDKEFERASAIVDAHPGTFFVPKPSTNDRDWGCADLPIQKKDNRLSHMTSHAKGKVMKDVMAQNIHPTVKSINLMRRLIRLVSKPGHTIIDPFLGSGTTGIAAVLEGRNFVGIERDPEYLKINHTRIASALREMGEDAQADALMKAVA
jgi:DNA modification methylase